MKIIIDGIAFSGSPTDIVDALRNLLFEETEPPDIEGYIAHIQNGVYWYDAKGSVSTIQMDKNAEALIYGLPVGKYQLEETVVPTNFFPAVPQAVEIAMTNTSEAPKEVVVVNTPTVKLGIDSDKFNVVIAIALTVLIGGGLAAYTIIRRRRNK